MTQRQWSVLRISLTSVASLLGGGFCLRIGEPATMVAKNIYLYPRLFFITSVCGTAIKKRSKIDKFKKRKSTLTYLFPLGGGRCGPQLERQALFYSFHLVGSWRGWIRRREQAGWSPSWPPGGSPERSPSALPSRWKASCCAGCWSPWCFRWSRQVRWPSSYAGRCRPSPSSGKTPEPSPLYPGTCNFYDLFIFLQWLELHNQRVFFFHRVHCFPVCIRREPVGVYLINHQPSRFFWITSTMTPFSNAISSFPWLVYDCTVMYFSSAKSRAKTQPNAWKHNPNKTGEKDVQHIWRNHLEVKLKKKKSHRTMQSNTIAQMYLFSLSLIHY